MPAYAASATEYIVDGSVTGDLGKYGIKLPTAATAVVVNFGTEYRQETYDFSPDYIFANGLASGGAARPMPINGHFHVNEYFFGDQRADRRQQAGDLPLGFEGGYRYSDYTSGFKTNTFKLGLEWAPIQDLRLRGSYNRAVRAPNIGDCIAPAAVGAGGTADPCWGATPIVTVGGVRSSPA